MPRQTSVLSEIGISAEDLSESKSDYHESDEAGTKIENQQQTQVEDGEIEEDEGPVSVGDPIPIENTIRKWNKQPEPYRRVFVVEGNTSAEMKIRMSRRCDVYDLYNPISKYLRTQIPQCDRNKRCDPNLIGQIQHMVDMYVSEAIQRPIQSIRLENIRNWCSARTKRPCLIFGLHPIFNEYEIAHLLVGGAKFMNLHELERWFGFLELNY